MKRMTLCAFIISAYFFPVTAFFGAGNTEPASSVRSDSLVKETASQFTLGSYAIRFDYKKLEKFSSLCASLLPAFVLIASDASSDRNASNLLLEVLYMAVIFFNLGLNMKLAKRANGYRIAHMSPALMVLGVFSYSLYYKLNEDTQHKLALSVFLASCIKNIYDLFPVSIKKSELKILPDKKMIYCCQQ